MRLPATRLVVFLSSRAAKRPAGKQSCALLVSYMTLARVIQNSQRFAQPALALDDALRSSGASPQDLASRASAKLIHAAFKTPPRKTQR